MLQVTRGFCDWVTAVGYRNEVNSFIGKLLMDEEAIPIHPAYFRHNALLYSPSGARVYYNAHDNQTEKIVVLDGKAMSEIRSSLYTDSDAAFLRALAVSCSHFTRVDVTVDILDGGLFARQLFEDTDGGYSTFGRRKAWGVKQFDDQGGTTVYVGARTSPKCMRVYDKTAETRGLLPASRVEFELKDQAAAELWQMARLSTDHSLLTKCWRGLAQDFFAEAHQPKMDEIMDGEVELIDIHRPMKDAETWGWLMKAVLPTFKTKGSTDRRQRLWSDFKHAVEDF